MTERFAYHCIHLDCGEAFDDRVVKANLTAKRRTLTCPFCLKKTPLTDLMTEPTAPQMAVAAKIGSDARRERNSALAKTKIKAKLAEKKYDVFLSYNSKNLPEVEKIAYRLRSVGILPYLDVWDLPPGNAFDPELVKAIQSIPAAAVFCGASDTGRWQAVERGFVMRWVSSEVRIVPVLLPDCEMVPELPSFLRQISWVDMRHWEEKQNDGFYRLICGIIGKAPGPDAPGRFGARDVETWWEE